MVRRLVVIGATVLAVAVTTVVVQVSTGSSPASAEGLTTYSDCSDYLAKVRQELTASATPYSVGGSASMGYGLAFSSSASTLASSDSGGEAQAASAGDAVGTGPAGTNVQEAGVDEPDSAKLADGRIVTINERVLTVRSTGPSPQILGSVGVVGKNFSASYGSSELLIVGDRALVVQGGVDFPTPSGYVAPEPFPGNKKLSYRAKSDVKTATVVALVDLSGGQPKLLESVTYDGSYLSARLSNGTVRLVTKFEPSAIPVMSTDGTTAYEGDALRENRRIASQLTIDDALPHLTRGTGAAATRTPAVDCTQVARPEEDSGTGLLVVSTLRPEEGLAQVDREAVAASGELVYASSNRLYVATIRHQFDWWFRTSQRAATGAATASSTPPPAEPTTEIHAFDTSDPRSTRYVASGSVPGLVVGRWAFSEHEGTLRVATTRRPNGSEIAGDVAQDVVPDASNDSSVPRPRPVSSSMVVKLRETDGKLVETARIAGLGKTEDIKSVRYFGDLAAVVTFRQTDPLYLLDLSGTPKVVGELKVPGYSTYLHPIGDGLLLAVGYDTDASGEMSGRQQVSVFDVAAPTRPRLVDRLLLGEGETPAVGESRAFTYDPAHRVLLLPFTPYDYKKSEVQAIRVGTDGSLTPAGSITTASAKRGEGIQPIDRVLYDDDNYYGVRPNQVITGDLDTLRRTS